MCDTLEYVAYNGVNCKACKRRTKEPMERILADDPWPQKCQQLSSEAQEERPELEMSSSATDWYVQCSKTILEKLKERGECGFVNCRTRDDEENHSQTTYSIYDMAIYRLAFIADISEVPRDVCTGAAQCGGLKPYQGRLQVRTGTPMLADAENAKYAAVVRKLLDVTKNNVQKHATAHETEQIKTLMLSTDEALGSVCKAALAAAWVAHSFQEGKQELTWNDVEGGVWCSGDIPTRQEVCS